MLVKAIEDAGLAGICSYIFHNREQLGCLRVRDGVLVLEKMYFANEIRDPKTARPGKRPKLKASELKMARELIDKMTTGFKPGNYEDSYRASLLKVIRRKAKGKTIAPPEPEEREELPDLMSALQASLKSSGRRKTARPKARRKPKAKAKAKAKARS